MQVHYEALFSNFLKIINFSLDFLDFRNYLSPASGFQSHQFRKIEVMLGLKINKRHHFGGCPYHDQFEGEKKEEILNLEEEKSLFSLIDDKIPPPALAIS